MPREHLSFPQRKARLAARLVIAADRGRLHARNRRLGQWVASDELVTNELIREMGVRLEIDYFSRLWTTTRHLPKPVFIRL